MKTKGAFRGFVHFREMRQCSMSSVFSVGDAFSVQSRRPIRPTLRTMLMLVPPPVRPVT